MKIDSVDRQAQDLLDLLVDRGPLTSAEICAELGWTKGRFGGALRRARETWAPKLDLAIPYATPETGWKYQVTVDWAPVEAGAAYAMGQAETRLSGVLRDVRSVKPHLERGTVEWRRANFLDKHLSHLLCTLEEISHG